MSDTRDDKMKMNVLVSGASGFVGTAVCGAMSRQGHRVMPLRREVGGDVAGPSWNPAAGEVDFGDTVPDAVIHLAGEGIAGMRWTSAKKRRIRESRVRGTRLLSEAVARLDPPPRVLVAASGIHFYGDCGAAELTEESGPGVGFLPEVCREWEQACDPARAAGVRVVHCRFGMILGCEGGALATMLPVFRFGLGGVVGSGSQFVSWVSLEDVVAAVVHAVREEKVSGAINVTGPLPVTNRDFTKALGDVIRRPTRIPVPSFMVRAVMGEMGETLLLASIRALPARLNATGFTFAHRTVGDALHAALVRGGAAAAG